MLWNLDPIWLALAIGTIAILSFLLGIIVDAVADDDAFGPVGNMLVMMAGFLGAILAANYRGVIFRHLEAAASVGLMGAFAAVLLLALVKAGLDRLTR